MENVTPPSDPSLKLSLDKDSVSESSRFGKKQDGMLWMERSRLAEMAPSLKTDPELMLDCLEHLTVMAMDDLLVVTYFLRSFDHPQKQLVLRTTVPSGKQATLPSVGKVWPTAVPFEQEMTERYGIRFTSDTSGTPRDQ